MIIFRHPNAQWKESVIRAFIQVLTYGTRYKKHATQAPLETDCITAVEDIARKAFNALIFPQDKTIPIESIRQVPRCMISNGWRPLLVTLEDVRCGDVAFVAKIGSALVSHAGMFLSQHWIFHSNLADQTGVVSTFNNFAMDYNTRLPCSQILPESSPAAGPARKAKSGLEEDSFTVASLYHGILASNPPSPTSSGSPPAKKLKVEEDRHGEPTSSALSANRVSIEGTSSAPQIPRRFPLQRGATAFNLPPLIRDAVDHTRTISPGPTTLA